ncbi:hypothetical protein D3C77_649220 [compost metagenome]
MAALDVKVEPGLQVQLTALRLLAQPLPVIAQLFELPPQLPRCRLQAWRQGLCLAITWLEHLQVDEVWLQLPFAIVPLRQFDALAEGNVVDFGGR